MITKFTLEKTALSFLFAILLLTGCGQGETRESTLNNEGVSREMLDVNASLSKPARKLNQLIDDGKLNAANKLLNAYLGQMPDDGGIHAMNGKLQLARTDIVFDFVPAESQIAGILNACRTAVEFDPKLKPFVADMIWRQVVADLNQAADEKSPIVFADVQAMCQEYSEDMKHSENPMGNFLEAMKMANIPFLGLAFQMRIGHTMVPGSWNQALGLAHELDPSVSAKRAKQLRGLASSFSEAGNFASGVFIEQTRTYYEGQASQEERVVLFFDLLTNRFDEIEASPKLKARANIALDQVAASGWKDEIIAVVDKQSPDSEIGLLITFLGD